MIVEILFLAFGIGCIIYASFKQLPKKQVKPIKVRVHNQ